MPAAPGHPPQPERQSNAIYCSTTAKTFAVVKDQIPAELIPDLKRDFTADEIEDICTRANLRTAPSVDAPSALWILGPSAVGKSFITGAKATQIFGVLQNAVVVDGTEFREVHAGFQAVAKHGQEHSLLHADAWPLFKKTALEASDGKLTLKRHILREALEKRKPVIIPDCAPPSHACPRTRAARVTCFSRSLAAQTARASNLAPIRRPHRRLQQHAAAVRAA